MWRAIENWLRKMLDAGDTPLHSAVRSFNRDVSLVRSLLEQDSSQVNVRNFNGESPLHLAVQNKRCNEELIELLLQHGADAKATIARNGNTALHCWAPRKNNMFNSYGVAEVLMRHGSDIDAKNLKGDTPLHLCLRGNADRDFRLFWFVKKVKDINAANSKGETPLHLAVRNKTYNKVFIVKMLLDNGADASKKDAKGENAYQAYCRAVRRKTPGSHPMLLILLQSKEWEYMESSLHVACLYQRLDLVENLLKMDADVNAVDNLCFPPTVWALNGIAADEDKFKIVRLMLDYGADINRQFVMRRDDGTSPTTLLELALGGIYEMERKDNRAVQMIILEHLAKLFAMRKKQVERGIKMGPVLSQKNSDIWNEFRYFVDYHTEYTNWRYQCSVELKTMSKTKIGVNSMSFLDLLFASVDKLTILVKNADLLKAFHAKKVTFPMYRGMMEAKLAKAQGRRKLIDDAAAVMSHTLTFADPSDEFYERTLTFCNNNDLASLIEAMKCNNAECKLKACQCVEIEN